MVAKMLSTIVFLACMARAHGYWCGLCNMSDKNYCCYGEGDTTYCCFLEDYLKGGFMDTQTMTIVAAVAVLVAVLVIISVCCCCCPCCPCHRSRRRGTVYNSVPRTSAPATRPPIFQTAAVGPDLRLSPAQYPVQHPVNPYFGTNASAPPYVPSQNQVM